MELLGYRPLDVVEKPQPGGRSISAPAVQAGGQSLGGRLSQGGRPIPKEAPTKA